jgi:hypothetical protein
MIAILPFGVRMAKLPRLNGAKVVALSAVGGLAISNLTRKIAKAASEEWG